MNKGLLFGIPMIVAVVVGLLLNSLTVYAPWFAGAVLLIGIVWVGIYIRRQKQQHTDNNEPGEKT